jgi:periplasmic protein TonB
MFEDVFVDNKATTRKPWTVFVSFLFQCCLIGILILIPLIYTEALPKQQLMGFLMAPPPPPPPPPPPAAMPTVAVKPMVREIEDGRLIAPKVIPKNIAMIKEDELPPPSAGAVGVVGGIPGGVPGGQIGGVIGGIVSATPVATPPPPPPPPKAEAPKRIRVGGQVQQAMLVSQPRPLYPPLAKQARIQGVVRLEAVISKTGTIDQLKVITGHPLLVQAALDAVKQWRYKPTFLNNEPVEVATTIDVNFTLSQ